MTNNHIPPSGRSRAQAWFPGRYVPIRHIQGAEILDRPRVGVQVNRTTLTGSAEELRSLGSQLLLAAYRLDQAKPVDEPVRRRRPVARRAA